MIPALLSERVQERRAQIDEDVSNVQRKSEEIERSVDRIENGRVHGDAHGNECDGVHGDEDDEVAPPDAPLIRAGHDVLARRAAILAGPLPFLLQHFLQVVDHHDNSRFADMTFELLVVLLAADGLLERRFSLFTGFLDFLPFVFQVLIPEAIPALHVHLHVLVSLKQVGKVHLHVAHF